MKKESSSSDISEGFAPLFFLVLYILSTGTLKTATVTYCNMISLYFSGGFTEGSVIRILNSINVSPDNWEIIRIVHPVPIFQQNSALACLVNKFNMNTS